MIDFWHDPSVHIKSQINAIQNIYILTFVIFLDSWFSSIVPIPCEQNYNAIAYKMKYIAYKMIC